MKGKLDLRVPSKQGRKNFEKTFGETDIFKNLADKDNAKINKRRK